MKIKAFLLMLVLVFFVACNVSEPDVGFDAHIEPKNEEFEVLPESEPEPPEIIEHEEPEPSPKIAVITQDFSSYLESDWLNEIIKRFGEENVIVYTQPRRNSEIADWINEIAQNHEQKIFIINPVYTSDNIAEILREQKDDIFIIYTERNVKNADLILDVNYSQMQMNFPAKAQEMGAETFIYFYAWYERDWETGEYIEWEESSRHKMYREKSEEIGLQFVAVRNEAAGLCGSSTAAYMSEAIPPLREEYGEKTILLGFESWRLFSRSYFLPIYEPWFEPTPFDIALRLGIIEWSDSDFHEKRYDIPYLIEEIRIYLEENSLGPIAFFPMSKQVLFPLAAIEYGLKRADGEVPQDGIDMVVLEKIMLELIYEYTGLEWKVNLTELVENDVIYENYILVLLDYLVY